MELSKTDTRKPNLTYWPKKKTNEPKEIVPMKCNTCQGTGKDPRTSDRCNECNGTGYLNQP